MASTVYKVGDRLFEGAHHEIRGKRRPIVRTWEILSVAPDPKWQDNDGQPLQVVTMRTNAKGAPKYRAESADFVDIDIVAGVWHFTSPRASMSSESRSAPGMARRDGSTRATQRSA